MYRSEGLKTILKCSKLKRIRVFGIPTEPVRVYKKPSFSPLFITANSLFFSPRVSPRFSIAIPWRVQSNFSCFLLLRNLNHLLQSSSFWSYDEDLFCAIAGLFRAVACDGYTNPLRSSELSFWFFFCFWFLFPLFCFSGSENARWR